MFDINLISVVAQLWHCVSVARFCSRLFHVGFLVDKMAL
jgi:hypothetical protein